jgi:hypothetical protein
MSNAPTRPIRGLPLLLFAFLFGWLASGCGDDSGVGRTVAVAGRVTIDNTPLTAKSTVVLFMPDASKGNTSPFEPTGTVDADGNYTLKTKGKNGAPPGWYKVVVTAHEGPLPQHPQSPQKHRPTVKTLVPARYGQEKTSDLSIEVVENPMPGAYDLKLTK